MKVIIEVPDSSLALAAMLAADEFDQEAIDEAVKTVKEHTTELDTKRLSNDTYMQQFHAGLALLAIAKAIDNQKAAKKKTGDGEKKD